MPFTILSPNIVTLNSGNGGPATAGFKEGDINIILSQPNAIGVCILPAKVKDPHDNNSEKECRVMIGISGYNVDEQGNTTTPILMNSPEHLAAVGCPPFNRAGGQIL